MMMYIVPWNFDEFRLVSIQCTGIVICFSIKKCIKWTEFKAHVFCGVVVLRVNLTAKILLFDFFFFLVQGHTV